MDRSGSSGGSRRDVGGRWRRAARLACACAVFAAAVVCNPALAWPSFMQLRRTEEMQPAPSRDADWRAPSRPFPGVVERGEEARVLWETVEAKGRLSPCWKRSLQLLNAKCAEVRSEESMRSQLALFMATCDAESDGRAHPHFHCGSAAAPPPPSQLSPHAVRRCVQALSDGAYAAFLQYRLHADVLCAYLEEELYQQRTEAAVAAMHAEMERSSHMLSTLQHTGAEVASLMRDTQTLQQESRDAAAALSHQLGLLHHGQAAALLALQQAAEDILRTSQHTDGALGELHTRVQEAAAQALASVDALSQESVKRFAAVEAQTRGVVRLMQQMDAMHHLLTQQQLSRSRVVWVLGCVSAALLLTCMPNTAAARLPALLLAVTGSAGLPLLGWWTGRVHWLCISSTAWEVLCLSAAALLVARCARRYAPQRARLWRGLAREEALRVWGEMAMQQRQRGVDAALSHPPALPPLCLAPPPHTLPGAAPHLSGWATHAAAPLPVVACTLDYGDEDSEDVTAAPTPAAAALSPTLSTDSAGDPHHAASATRKRYRLASAQAISARRRSKSRRVDAVDTSSVPAAAAVRTRRTPARRACPTARKS